MTTSEAAAGQDKALGAATRWAIERFAAPSEEPGTACGEKCETDIPELQVSQHQATRFEAPLANFANVLEEASPQAVKSVMSQMFETLPPALCAKMLEPIEVASCSALGHEAAAPSEPQSADFSKVLAEADPETVKLAALQLLHELTPTDYAGILQPLEEATRRLLPSPPGHTEAQGLEAAGWKLAPSVGTWMMPLPRPLATLPAASDSKGTTRAVASTPRKVCRGKSPAKSPSPSPKVDLQRSPRRTAPPSVPSAAAAATPSKQRQTASAQKREAVSPRPSPRVPARTAPAKAASAPAQEEPAPAADVKVPEVSPAASETPPQPQQGEAKKATQTSAPSTQAKVASKAAAKPTPKVPDVKATEAKARAKSPPVRPATTPRGPPVAARAAPVAQTSAKSLSSADIEAQKIEEARKEAKLLAQKNARRMMNRAASAKTLQAPSKESEAALAPSTPPAAKTEGKTMSRPVQQRPPSPLRKTSPPPKETPKVAAKAKAVVATTPTPSKNATKSPRPQQATAARPVTSSTPASQVARDDFAAPRAASASRKVKSPAPTVSSASKLTRVPSATLRVAKKPAQATGKEAEKQKATSAAVA
eukprot:TRINITY_DN1450_c0_g1_i1.p1 TRINITY_DN1450_c0_g1~~TRINITY_DN1450_c0_g1_i1.p1  ORF type:complete len:594 (-),score=161.44 TRINITY_DN1450_c0_g1_i1:126-1907(-)